MTMRMCIPLDLWGGRDTERKQVSGCSINYMVARQQRLLAWRACKVMRETTCKETQGDACNLTTLTYEPWTDLEILLAEGM